MPAPGSGLQGRPVSNVVRPGSWCGHRVSVQKNRCARGRQVGTGWEREHRLLGMRLQRLPSGWYFDFSIQLGMSSSQLTFIFFRGIETTNQIKYPNSENGVNWDLNWFESQFSYGFTHNPNGLPAFLYWKPWRLGELSVQTESIANVDRWRKFFRWWR